MVNFHIFHYKDEKSDKIWGYAFLDGENGSSWKKENDRMVRTKAMVFWGRRGSKLSTNIKTTFEAGFLHDEKVRKGYKNITLDVMNDPNIIGEGFLEHLEASHTMALMKI